MPSTRVAVVLSVFTGLVPLHAQAASVPVGFVDTQVAAGLTSPTAMAVIPGGRVLVTQQNGLVRIIKHDALLPMPFYSVDTDFAHERGLLGVAADPGFATNHYVYLYFTAKTPVLHNRILRVTEANDVAVPGSEQVVFDLPEVPAGTKWHMGGALKFGPDGKLYVAVGNHEDDWIASSKAQDLTSAFGKILRINADGTIPADNPFYNTAGAYRAIWSYGFRNPFTFAIQPATGVTFINDVGGGSYEEVNRGQRGGNYGWSAIEGNGTNPAYLNPAYTYAHSEGCAVVGGAFYNPTAAQFPSIYVGKYLFADFCQGWVRMLDPASNAVSGFITGISYPVNLDVSTDGALYYLARNQSTGNPNQGTGTVSKVTYTGSQVPRITRHPQSQTVVVGEPVTFSVGADGATGYRWQRNGVDIAGATGTSYTIASTTTSDSGAAFRAVVSNSFGSVTSSSAILTVSTNRRPVPTIQNPPAGTTYAAGQTITFSGTASDPEDGTLPASAFTWQVDYQHDTHAHPFLAPMNGTTSGSFTVPSADAPDANIWYRVYLTVTDSVGLTQSTTRDVRPRTALSDMAWVGTPANGWGPVERDKSNGEEAAGDGRTISLDQIPYAKGLGVHAPSEIRYNLGGACSGRFIADVGVDDESTGGTVVFQIWLDGALAFDSGLVSVLDLRKPVNLNVAGTNELRLVVTDGGDGTGMDHGDWAGARVTGCGGSPTPTATPTPTPTPPPVAGYSTFTARHSGKRLDVSGASTADLAGIVQWTANTGTSQQWQLTDMGAGYYRIGSRASGKCLDVSGFSTVDGASLIQYTCGTGTNQQWSMTDAGAGYVQLRARHSGKCLDVEGASLADGARLLQWTCGTGTNQHWLRQSSSPTATPTPTPTVRPTSRPTPTPTPTPTPAGPVEITPGAAGVTASTHDGNVPGNTVDNSLSTRWSANGDGQWIRYDLGATRTVTHVRLAFYNGNLRQGRFDLQLSNDGVGWTNVLTGALSSGTTTQEQTFDFADSSGRYLRYLGHGNSVNAWNSLTEVSVFAVP